MQDFEDHEIRKKIHELFLFKDAPETEIEVLLSECTLKVYRQSKKLTYFRSANEGLFIILKGMAEIFIENEDGKSTVLEVLQEGEIIGFSNLAFFLGETNRPLDRHHLEMDKLPRIPIV